MTADPIAPSDGRDIAVLVVEDDASMARLMGHLLELDGYTRVRHVWTGAAAAQAAAEAGIILLDHQLPDVRGIDLLPRILRRHDPPSVIMVTAHGNESLAARALREGAEDYLTKDHTLPELLPRILERVRRNRALRAALAEAERELVQAERLTAVGELSVTLHHELNNPMMAALAESELLLAESDLPPLAREGLETIRTALLRMAGVLKQATDLRRAESATYLGGTRMIALEGTTEEAPPYRGTALLWHPDQRVRRVLALLLGQEGFHVERPGSLADLQQAATRVGVSLVLVGETVRGELPLSGFVPMSPREYAVIALGREHEDASRAAGADGAIALPFDPATVMHDVLECVARRAQDSATSDVGRS